MRARDCHRLPAIGVGYFLKGPAPPLLPPGVEFVDALAEVLYGARAADLHGGRQFAVLDGEIAAQYAMLAHLLEGSELSVHSHHRLVNFGDHRRCLCDLGRRTAFPLFHAFQRFGDGKVDGEQGRQERQAVANQQHLADQRLHLEKTLHARRKDLLARGRNDQLLLAPRDEHVAVTIHVAKVPGVQAAVAQYFGGGDGVVEIPGKEAGTLHQDLVIVAERDLDAGQRLADAPGLGTIQRVERDHAAFGEAVAFADRHADGFVELSEVLAEGGRSAGGDPQPASEAAAHFAEEDAVGQRQRHAYARRHRFTRVAVPRRRQSQAKRPIEALAEGSRPLAKLGADGGVDPLPHARRRQQHGGTYLAYVLRQLQQALEESHRHAAAHGQKLHHHALRDVRGRQKRHRGILRSYGERRRTHIDIGGHGLVRDQRHLGLARGAARQVENRRVGGRDAAQYTGEQFGIPGERFASQPAQRL